jgi:hypothetical protein
VAAPPSTLLTSRVSQLDFVGRLAFFALAPIGIVRLAALFPMWGALLNVALALLVFLAREAIHARSARWPWLQWLLSRELSLDAYYRGRRPRPFIYYVLYPLLFPYWLVDAEARREFLLFKGYTLTSIALLLVSVVIQYFVSWRPELGIAAYLPVVGVTLAMEMVLVLALLMPIATTVIGLHQSGRRRRLVALLLAALASTTAATLRLAHRRDPIVSYATRERVRLRTAADTDRSREAQLAALRMGWAHWREFPQAVEGDGKVEGEPLDAAHEELRTFYKRDEAYAFDLWASPRNDPKLLVLYFEARRGRAPIWIAMKRGGEMVRDPKQLPKGAFVAMLRAALQ